MLVLAITQVEETVAKSASRRDEFEGADAAMRQDVRPVATATLENLRDAARRKRDLDLRISSKKEELKLLNIEANNMEFSELPSLFMQARVDHVGVPAEGNMPAYDATLTPYYSASISSKWSSERQSEALDVVTKLGLEDTIKTVFEVQLGKGTSVMAKKLRAAFKKLGVEFAERRTVPWNTLTAAVKDFYKRGKPLSDSDLKALGATVGNVVTLTERRD